jgi:hypothetical protein
MKRGVTTPGIQGALTGIETPTELNVTDAQKTIQFPEISSSFIFST